MSESFAAERPAIDPSVCTEPVPYADMRERRDEIEALHLQGYSNREIADKLGGRTLDVARNLREVRRRWLRCAQRQELVHEVRAAELYRESVEAWRRSQEPKRTVTTVTETANGKVTVRKQQGPGDAGFLRAAKGALGLLRQFAAKMPAAAKPGRSFQAATLPLNGRESSSDKPLHEANELIVSLLNLMTPEQIRRIDPNRSEVCLRAFEDCNRHEADLAKEAVAAEAASRESGPAADAFCAADAEDEVPPSTPVAASIEARSASERKQYSDVEEAAIDAVAPPVAACDQAAAARATKRRDRLTAVALHRAKRGFLRPGRRPPTHRDPAIAARNEPC